MKSSPLFFGGTRWPAARLEVPPHPDDRSFLPRVGIGISGKGRPWSAHDARGFWRTLPEVNTAEEAVRWVARYGDVYGELSTDNRLVFTDTWRLQADQLGEIANYWRAPGDDGVSYFADRTPPEVTFENLTVRISASTWLTPVCENLSIYMLFSAFDAARRKVPMRRCEVCNHWFELRRSTGRVCSNACQIIKSSREKGNDNGVDA
jgi:hypothetical protein